MLERRLVEDVRARLRLSMADLQEPESIIGMSSAGGLVPGGDSFAPSAGSVNTFTSGVVGGGGPADDGFALKHSDGADPDNVNVLPF